MSGSIFPVSVFNLFSKQSAYYESWGYRISFQKPKLLNHEADKGLILKNCLRLAEGFNSLELKTDGVVAAQP